MDHQEAVLLGVVLGHVLVGELLRHVEPIDDGLNRGIEAMNMSGLVGRWEGC
jgi:hypothetical protein